jgi:hypothetical protein
MREGSSAQNDTAPSALGMRDCGVARCGAVRCVNAHAQRSKSRACLQCFGGERPAGLRAEGDVDRGCLAGRSAITTAARANLQRAVRLKDIQCCNLCIRLRKAARMSGLRGRQAAADSTADTAPAMMAA